MSEREAFKLIRARSIRLLWDGSKICALVGDDLASGVAGFGDDVPEALFDLVNRIRGEQITIWVSRAGETVRGKRNHKVGSGLLSKSNRFQNA